MKVKKFLKTIMLSRLHLVVAMEVAGIKEVMIMQEVGMTTLELVLALGML